IYPISRALTLMIGGRRVQFDLHARDRKRIWLSGLGEAPKQVEVRARVSATLDKINFADGQLVKEGDLLFVIDPRPYQIAVDSAKADVTKAQAQVALAATDANRAQQLAESRSITPREVDQRKANLEVAKAQQL